jgi:sulfide:quinone oxidoreductase
VVSDAGTHRYDHLVIALGVAYDWDAVPGSATAHTFYTTPGAWRLRDRLAALEGGRVVIGIGGVPYRCPPAPIEGAMHIDAALRRRGIRDQVTIDLVIPEPAPLGVAGPEASARVRHALAERGIALRTERTVTGVDGHRARCSDGSHLDGDLIVTVPVHRVPDVVASSGLTAGQAWVPVDATTMETDWSNVFAVGDVNSIPVGTVAVPKAGVFASGQGVHVAATIASRVLGTTPPDPYDGTGFCLFEFGPDRVAEVGGTFLAAEGPEVGLSEPSSDLSGKETWVADWEAFRI